MRRLAIVLLAAISTTAVTADEAGKTWLYILGIAQDAGYPQAGCYRPHCMPPREDPSLRRLATAVALVDERLKTKYLFEATPDINEQLYRLHRVAPDGDYTLGGVFLTHAHIGHYTGLMHFGHEAMGARGINVYAMPRMRDFLATNGPWSQLVDYGNIVLRPIEGDAVEIAPGVEVAAFVVPHRDEYSETVGYRIRGPNRSAVFIPDIDKWSKWDVDIRDIIRGVDYALLDATFYGNGEIPGRDMSEFPHPFVEESMALFDSLTDAEKNRVIFIHMNHTNPLLRDGSPEHGDVKNRGFRVAYEGMRIEL